MFLKKDKKLYIIKNIICNIKYYLINILKYNYKWKKIIL